MGPTARNAVSGAGRSRSEREGGRGGFLGPWRTQERLSNLSNRPWTLFDRMNTGFFALSDCPLYKGNWMDNGGRGRGGLQAPSLFRVPALSKKHCLDYWTNYGILNNSATKLVRRDLDIQDWNWTIPARKERDGSTTTPSPRQEAVVPRLADCEAPEDHLKALAMMSCIGARSELAITHIISKQQKSTHCRNE
jgi:hypothetical protein